MKHIGAKMSSTLRRLYLDRMLTEVLPIFFGRVLDVGGKKEKRRGGFQPPYHQVVSWEYVNIDETTNPDFLCSADDIPLPTQSVDVILLAEVLEHLENPERALAEMARLLKANGHMVLTMPFLNSIHADPYDFQRWTPSKIRNVLSACGLKVEYIKPMGGPWSVIYDVLRVHWLRRATTGSWLAIVSQKMLRLCRGLFLRLDSKASDTAVVTTTGWFVVACMEKSENK